MTDEINAKKNNNIEFKLKKEKIINFKIVMMTNEKDVIIKEKISIENNNLYMFEILDVKNSIEWVSTKHYIDNTTLILNLFETSTFDVKIFSE